VSRLLIECGPYASRVALLEDGRVAEVQVEDPVDPGVVGNIYKGHVSKVLPGIEAAFIAVGLDRDTFLYAGDIHSPYPVEDELEDSDPALRRREPINELLNEGDEILVQVVKDALPNKGARVTAQISLPGRFAVLLPGSDGIGISRRLDDGDERERLSGILESRRPEGTGLIARTAAAGRSAEEIERDIAHLESLWEEIESSARRKSSPDLIYRELDLPQRFLRDQAISNLEEIVVDSRETFEHLADYLERLEPELRRRMSLSDKPESLFEESGVDETIRRALRGRAWLPSGGYVVINPTEALVAIDVNTGRYTSSDDIESTALKVNAEAAVEIASQIRLRDLSGIIVVDFIDMERAENRNEVIAVFSEALERDRTKVQISGMSQLGLVELTRKRSHTDLSRRLTEPCPCCAGRGRTRATKTVCLELRRSLIRFCESQPDRSFYVRSHPRVLATLEGELSALREEIETTIGRPLDLRQDPDLRPDEYEIVAD